MRQTPFTPDISYMRVATACPPVVVADVEANIGHITDLYKEACDQQVSIVAFPELSITGYTLGDLVQQSVLLGRAAVGLQSLAELTEGTDTAMVVGLPLQVRDGLYNCAAVLAGGRTMGIVPKSHLPTYNEFYEDRWYEPWPHPTTTVEVGGKQVPFGNDLLFAVGGVTCGVEICEDLWVADSPSVRLAKQGAQVIINPSASPEQVDKAQYRRDLVRLQSGRLVAGYVYAGCDVSESTAEIVMGGHQLIAANGRVLAESVPFSGERLTMADIDIDHLVFDRRKQHVASLPDATIVQLGLKRRQSDLRAAVERDPFLPGESDEARAERLESALTIQAHGLAMRMRASRQERLVLGLSGGLDSTLALLVACEAARILGKQPGDMIRTLTMPGPASSENTQDNAQQLAAALHVPNVRIPINDLVATELAALGHDGETQDTTYENVQARARTSLLFNYANQHKAMVLGTGDLSEIALGWCTYNADQQSHYNVNATIPKTLVRHLVTHLAGQPRYKRARNLLRAIVDTPVSPELTKQTGNAITQSTEELIGPYELHDFFLYHLVRWGDEPSKIIYLAGQAFADKYSAKDIEHWFGVFTTRFAVSQFKRETLPNGPKVGSVSLSPRGDWRMPPDLQSAALWSRTV